MDVSSQKLPKYGNCDPFPKERPTDKCRKREISHILKQSRQSGAFDSTPAANPKLIQGDRFRWARTNTSRSQISFEDLWVVQQFRARTRECDLAVFHDVCEMRDLERLTNVLLDQQNRQAPVV